MYYFNPYDHNAIQNNRFDLFSLNCLKFFIIMKVVFVIRNSA